MPISLLAFIKTPGQAPDATAIGALSVATKHAALHALIEPIVAAMGFELWGIEHVSQGKHSRLVIYIERESGVSVEDCADISRQVSAVMDVEDPIPGEYRLEVSSPGMARPLYSLDHFSLPGPSGGAEATPRFRWPTQVPGVVGWGRRRRSAAANGRRRVLLSH